TLPDLKYIRPVLLPFFNPSEFLNSVFLIEDSCESNNSLNNLTGSGFNLVYNQNYSHTTSMTDLENIKSQCSSNSVLCAAGGLANSDCILLKSCANCQAVLTPTIINSPVFVDSAYWYLTDGQSFGFAPDSTVNQHNADTQDKSSPYRLSWHLNGHGGYRLGNITDLNSDNNYKKYRKYKLKIKIFKFQFFGPKNSEVAELKSKRV
ncbi:kinesin kif17, partial [Brachionus plicatilis]